MLLATDLKAPPGPNKGQKMSDVGPEISIDAARGYEALFVPAVFTPWPKHLIRAAGVSAGAHVLDVATGTGALARQALAVTGGAGRVVGLDPTPAMLAVAAEVTPVIEWVLGPAEAMDLPDASFDSVVSQFGMMFFLDPPAAAREMHRVLRPGGRLALAVWDKIENSPAYREIAEIVEADVGAAAADAVRLPFSLGCTTDLTAPFAAAGFVDIEVTTLTETARFPSVRALVQAELGAWLPIMNIHLEDAQTQELLARAESALAPYANAAGEAVFPMSAHVLSARRN